MQLSPNTELQSGKYRIIRVLGQGGFGITYLAQNTLLERTVAIKEFFPKELCGRDNTSHLTLGTQNNTETVARLRARFLREARNIARLDHPGIVHIHDVFEENNTAYYVMDYIDGENLNEMVKRDGPMPEETAIAYITCVGDALAYIHSRQMTHFDVKPANIMVRRSDNQPVLIDFGLSKQYDASGGATSTLMQAVSHGYSPMEMYIPGRIKEFSPETDVYSLAATLCYLLTSQTPPYASDIQENGLTLPASISAPIAAILSNVMTVKRTERPHDTNQFINGLQLSVPHQYSASTDETTFSGQKSHNEETQYIHDTTFTQSKAEPNPNIVSTPKKTKNSSLLYIAIVMAALFIVNLVFIHIPDSNIGINESTLSDNPVDEIHNTPNIVDTTLFYFDNMGTALYSGPIDSDKLPHGNGFAKITSGQYAGNTYTGGFKHGVMSGECTYTLKNGDQFIGTFENNHYFYGQYKIASSGEYYYGPFRNGQPTSEGTWHDSYGRILE